MLQSLITEVLDEAILGGDQSLSAIAGSLKGNSLVDLAQAIGVDRLLQAAYISGQLEEPIDWEGIPTDPFNEGDPFFDWDFLRALKAEWEKGAGATTEKYG